jgi:hypothetical protein
LQHFPSVGLMHSLHRSYFNLSILFQVFQGNFFTLLNAHLESLLSPERSKLWEFLQCAQHSRMCWFCARSNLLNALLEESGRVFSNSVLCYLMCIVSFKVFNNLEILPQVCELFWCALLAHFFLTRNISYTHSLCRLIQFKIFVVHSLHLT